MVLSATVTFPAAGGATSNPLSDTLAPRGVRVEPRYQLTGTLADMNLLKAEPAKGFITDAAEWQKLWHAWRGKVALPPVDFAKEFVLVFTARGPNAPQVQLGLDKQGNLNALEVRKLAAGGGFSYRLAVVSRKGVATVNRRPLVASVLPDPLLGPVGVPVVPSQQLTGRVGTRLLWDLEPERGYVSNSCEFARLWKRWGAKGPVPQVDFQKNVVMVFTGYGYNIPAVKLGLDADGNLDATVRMTLMGGPGFSYRMLVIPRTGIRTVYGLPFDRPFVLPAELRPAGQPLTPVRQWRGSVSPSALAKAPAAGFVAGAEAFEQLWQAWRGNQPVPKIDFQKHLVLVATARGRAPGYAIGLDKAGNLQVHTWRFGTNRYAGGYRFLVVPRQGIQTVNGVPLNTQ
jgi:hypothetical protein